MTQLDPIGQAILALAFWLALAVPVRLAGGKLLAAVAAKAPVYDWTVRLDRPRGWRGRHRVRPALIAPAEHAGATVDWSPIAELAAAQDREPEETPAEAVVRDAEEIVDHWAAEYAAFEADVRSWFDALVKDDPIAAVLLDEERERLARKASAAAADGAAVPTGEWPLVRIEVSA